MQPDFRGAAGRTGGPPPDFPRGAVIGPYAPDDATDVTEILPIQSPAGLAHVTTTAAGGTSDDPAVAGAAPGALGTTLKRGAKISAMVLLLVQLSSLASTLLVGRLLDPAEVGLYAAGTALTGFMVMFAEGGLRGALVQRDGDITVASDTVFWVTTTSGVVMSAGAFAAAPLVARLFDNEAVGEIAAITSGLLMIYALINVPEALLQRNFNFKKRLYVDPGRSLAYGIVTVALAASGFGVWSLVIGNYVSMLVWLIGVWILARWRPGRGRFDFRLWRQMAKFSLPLLLERIGEQARDTGQSVLIGRSLGEGLLGNYRYGRRLAMLPGVAVIEISGFVLFPAFSRLAADPARLKDAFLKVMRWIWFGAAPIAGIAVALGEPIVVVLLGEPWRAAGGMFAAMAGFGIGIALQSASSEAIKGAGQTRLLNWTTLTRLVLGLGLLIALLPFGLVGVGLSISITEIVVGLIMLGLSRRIVGFTVREMARPLVPPLVGSVLATAVVAPLEVFVVRAGDRGILIGLGCLAVEAALFAVIYLGLLRILDPPMVVAIIDAARARIRRRAGKDEPGDPTNPSADAPVEPLGPPPPPRGGHPDGPAWPPPDVEATRPVGMWAVGTPDDATEIMPAIRDRRVPPQDRSHAHPRPAAGTRSSDGAPVGVRMLGGGEARVGAENRGPDAPHN